MASGIEFSYLYHRSFDMRFVPQLSDLSDFDEDSMGLSTCSEESSRSWETESEIEVSGAETDESGADDSKPEGYDLHNAV